MQPLEKGLKRIRKERYQLVKISLNDLSHAFKDLEIIFFLLAIEVAIASRLHARLTILIALKINEEL